MSVNQQPDNDPWHDLSEIQRDAYEQPDRPLNRLGEWRGGLIGTWLIATLLGTLVLWSSISSRTAAGAMGWLVVGTAVALYAFPLATARARSERMPIWLVLPVVGMQLWAGFQTGPSTWIGWVILADGLVLLTAVSLARHRLRQTRA